MSISCLGNDGKNEEWRKTRDADGLIDLPAVVEKYMRPAHWFYTTRGLFGPLFLIHNLVYIDGVLAIVGINSGRRRRRKNNKTDGYKRCRKKIDVNVTWSMRCGCKSAWLSSVRSSTDFCRDFRCLFFTLLYQLRLGSTYRERDSSYRTALLWSLAVYHADRDHQPRE